MKRFPPATVFRRMRSIRSSASRTGRTAGRECVTRSEQVAVAWMSSATLAALHRRTRPPLTARAAGRRRFHRPAGVCQERAGEMRSPSCGRPRRRVVHAPPFPMNRAPSEAGAIGARAKNCARSVFPWPDAQEVVVCSAERPPFAPVKIRRPSPADTGRAKIVGAMRQPSFTHYKPFFAALIGHAPVKPSVSVSPSRCSACAAT